MHVLLLDLLALLVEQILLQVLHQSDILKGVAPLVVYWLTIVVELDGVAAKVVEAALLDQVLEEVGEVVSVVFNPPLHARVPVVLDGVVSATLEEIGDVSPLVRLISVQQVKDPLLLSRPGGVPLDHWVEMVVPSFTALLADSSREMVGDLSPLLRTVEVDQVQQQSILDVSPWTFDESGVENLLPPMEALDISSSSESLGDLLPVLASIDFDCLCKLLVLALSPVALDFHRAMVLSSLVLCWASLVEMRIKHLMANQPLLSFTIG